MGAPTPILAAVDGGKTDELAALLAQRPKLTVCEAAAVGDPALLREAPRTDAAGVVGRADVRIVATLLGRGAEPGARAGGGYAPLHVAASGGNLALINVLLAHGATAEARTDDGRTALALAEERGHADALRRLRGEMP